MRKTKKIKMAVFLSRNAHIFLTKKLLLNILNDFVSKKQKTNFRWLWVIVIISVWILSKTPKLFECFSYVYQDFLSPIFTDLLSRVVTTVSVVFTCPIGQVWRWSERGMGRVLNASHHILSRVVTTTPHFFFNRALLSVDSSMLFWMKSNTSLTRWETPEASLSSRDRCAMWQLIFSLH